MSVNVAVWLLSGAGTTGYNATVDLRYHWMHQKRLQGSHFANDDVSPRQSIIWLLRRRLTLLILKVFSLKESVMLNDDV